MDAQKHDEIMSYIMNKLEEENVDLSGGMSLWHSMGLFIFSHLDLDNKDISKIYSDMKLYLEENEKLQKAQD